MAYVEANGERRDLPWLFKNARAATRVRVWGRDLTKLPRVLPETIEFRCGPSPKLEALPALPVATTVRVWGCTGLSELPALPAADHVAVWECPNFRFSAGPSSRGNVFVAARVRGHWRICVGCKVFTIGDCRIRWGVGTNPRAPAGDSEALALAEDVFAKVLAAHPDAAADQVVDDPFYVLPQWRPIYAAMGAAEQNVRGFVNFVRAMRGEPPIPARTTPAKYDLP